LHKPAFEAYATELGPIYKEIKYLLKHLHQWMQPVRVGTPFVFFPSKSIIYNDPLGVILIIAPWNYPFNLIVAPLIAAIAGGNTCILKPSEFSIHTSAVIKKIITENFNENYIAVMEGKGEEVLPPLIEIYPLNHIFYTGSTEVGKKIMRMAAKNLIPVTLELGGKSPCIIDKTAHIKYAAKKIAWSKFMNAGQTCVAPDYILIHENVKEVFILEIKEVLLKMYGENPQQSKDYSRIINERFDTLAGYLQQGDILLGGQTDVAAKFIAPTVIENISMDDPIMQEEIFGPILPLMTFKTIEETLPVIESSPYPLALYIYTSDKKTEKFFIENVRFGGGCINNGLIHLGNPDLPFGGVGYSGTGQYHGKYGFDIFTRPKSILKSPTWFDIPLWYAPYKNNIRWLKKIF
jgi:aldehyde dehydrogenase (NAD+)